MRTFAQKTKASQQTSSGESKTAGRGYIGQSYEVNSILHLQRAIGNQAVQRMLHTHAEEVDAGSTGTALPNFRHDFARIPVSPPKEGTLQTKLAINKPRNEYEQEADQVANHVMRMPPSTLHRRACGSAAGPDGEDAACEAKQLDWHRKGENIPHTDAPPSVHQTIRKLGHPLDSTTRALMEARFGQDFSAVRVHNDAQAAQSAADVDAQAYTVGQNVVFGAGRYAPGTPEGQKLLAHELTHVVQQNHNLSRKPAMLMRQHRGRGHHQAAPVPTTFYQQLYVVRDSSIGMGGGHLVADLAAFKADVMRLQNTGTWTLVLSIHGSLDRIAAQAPPNWQQDAVFYTAANINALFNGDPAWVKWRDMYGPSHVALVSCQVSASFEDVMINNLTRHVIGAGSSTAAPTQSRQGMGTHCKPLSDAEHYYHDGTPITTRGQYQRLSASAKQEMESILSTFNSRYGYYGAPPVPNSEILDYYFDVDPRGSWVNVTVGIDQGGTVSDTDIPFWNRTAGPRSAEFRRLCDQGVGILTRQHIPRVP